MIRFSLISFIHLLCLTSSILGLDEVIVNQDVQHSQQLKSFDSLQKCKDTGEAYSASYLITKEHLIHHNTDYNLTWVNCEMASFIMFNQHHHHHHDNTMNAPNGTVFQSLDVLDFSVIHLSWFERLQKRYKIKIPSSSSSSSSSSVGHEPLKELSATLRFLKFRANSQTRQSHRQSAQLNLKSTYPAMPATTNIPTTYINSTGSTSSATTSANSTAASSTPPPTNTTTNTPPSATITTSTTMARVMNRTLVVMPYLGSENGAGHSKLNNRLLYLQACFWSFTHQYHYIVAAVKNLKDYQYAKYDSSLPFYDVLLIENLPKSASLPVATIQEVKLRLKEGGKWSHRFDYIFFTESDQLLMMRIQSTLYTFLAAHPRAVLVPHRLVPYPQEVLSLHHHRVPTDTSNSRSSSSSTTNNNNKTTGISSRNNQSIHYSPPPPPPPHHHHHRHSHSKVAEKNVRISSDSGSQHHSSGTQQQHEQRSMDWLDLSCHLPRQQCEERKSWVGIKNVSVPIIHIYGLTVALGNVNFHQEMYRACTLTINNNNNNTAEQ